METRALKGPRPRFVLTTSLAAMESAPVHVQVHAFKYIYDNKITYLSKLVLIGIDTGSRKILKEIGLAQLTVDKDKFSFTYPSIRGTSLNS